MGIAAEESRQCGQHEDGGDFYSVRETFQRILHEPSDQPIALCKECCAEPDHESDYDGDPPESDGQGSCLIKMEEGIGNITDGAEHLHDR